MILALIFMFLKIGFLGFGGGYAMLSLIFQEGIALGLTVEQFADMNVLDVLIPGPIAINSATYVGFLLAGFVGSVVATVAVSSPSFIFVPVMLRFEKKIDNNVFLKNMLHTAKAASVGLISGVGVLIFLKSAFNISDLKNVFQSEINYFLIGVTVIGWILHDKFKVNPIILTIIAGVLGYLSYYIM